MTPVSDVKLDTRHRQYDTVLPALGRHGPLSALRAARPAFAPTAMTPTVPVSPCRSRCGASPSGWSTEHICPCDAAPASGRSAGLAATAELAGVPDVRGAPSPNYGL